MVRARSDDLHQLLVSSLRQVSLGDYLFGILFEMLAAHIAAQMSGIAFEFRSMIGFAIHAQSANVALSDDVIFFTIQLVGLL